MKTSVSIFLTDILPHRRRTFNKIVKSKIFDHHNAKNVFSKLKDSGIDGVELLLPQYVKVTDSDIYEVRDVLKENKTEVFSLHQTIRFFTKTKLAEIVNLFHVADILGAKVIVLHMNSAGKQVKYIGSLHRPHTWHEEKFIDVISEHKLHITLDTTHLGHSGGDIITFFKKNKSRIINIHLSDYRPHFLNSSLRPLRYKHLPIGEGMLPLTEFFALLKKENYQGIVTLEINADLEGICESAKQMNAVLMKKNAKDV
jgi:sugar phosphate isomerase/epimerase